MITTVTFRRHGDAYVVRFRYDPALVELLKAVVPAYARSWNTSTREWTVNVDYANLLASAVRSLGHRAIGLDPQQPPPRNNTHTDPAQWAMDLLHRVGPTRREPVFRALTKVLHPDNQQTGDTRLKRELNDARAELE